jgi:hypothetical protein
MTRNPGRNSRSSRCSVKTAKAVGLLRNRRFGNEHVETLVREVAITARQRIKPACELLGDMLMELGQSELKLSENESLCSLTIRAAIDSA